MSLWLMPGLKTLHRLSFNIGVLVISIWTGVADFLSVFPESTFSRPNYTSLTLFVGPLYIFTACCFLLNSGMVATALAIERASRVYASGASNFCGFPLTISVELRSQRCSSFMRSRSTGR